MKSRLDKDLNLFGIKIPRASLRQGTLFLGTTGSGKTRGLIRPALDQLLARGDAAVIVDVKGDLLPIVVQTLKRCGRSADLVTLGAGKHDQTFNPLADGSLSPHQIVNQLQLATSITGQESGQRTRAEEMFWMTSRTELLCSLVELAQKTITANGDQTPLTFAHLQKLRRLLSKPSASLVTWACEAAELLSENGAAGLIEFAAYPDSTRACVLGSAMNLIAPFTRPPLAQLVMPTPERPHFEIADVYNRSKVLVVTATQAEHAAEIWPGMMLFKLALYRSVLSRPRLPVRQDNELVIVLDEYNRLIMPHDCMASEHLVMEASRASRTSFILAAQNLSGLEAIGGNLITDKIAALCSNFVFLNNNCPVTARLAQRVLGTKKTFEQHQSVSPLPPPPWLFPESQAMADRKVVNTVLVPTETPVVSPAELSRLPAGTAHMKLADGSLHRFQCTFD